MQKLKKIVLLLGLVITTMCANAQNDHVLIGCFSGSNATLSYSSAQMDAILTYATEETVQNSTLMKDPITNCWYIHANSNNSTIGVPIIIENDKVFLGPTCKHRCVSKETCECDISNIVACTSHTCSCPVGSGGCTSEVIIGGVVINNNVINYVNQNPVNCN